MKLDVYKYICMYNILKNGRLLDAPYLDQI